MNEDIIRYLSQTLPSPQDWVIDLEKQAIEDHVPIMEKAGIHFVMQLVKVRKPDKILEIGTAIGYSALRMNDAYSETSIITIEKDEKRYHQALENINRLNKQDSIKVIHGDALDKIDMLKDTGHKFEIIFIDAAKGQYQRFFELCVPLLDNNGIIITDNVLFRGYVANPESVPKRYKNMVHKIRNYNEYIMNHSDFYTSILPIGDGVAISYKL